MPKSAIHLYEHFVMKASRPSLGIFLCFNDHLFFSDIPDIPQKQRDFFGVFAKEGDIFERFIFDWRSRKELILRGIFEGLQELEFFPILDVLDQVISKVAHVVTDAEKAGSGSDGWTN